MTGRTFTAFPANGKPGPSVAHPVTGPLICCLTAGRPGRIVLMLNYMTLYSYGLCKSTPFLIMSARTRKKPPPVSEEALALIAAWFRTLGEPSRLKILRALEEGEKNISELVEATGLTQANVSRHVQSLVDAGMVGRRREGLTAICFIADPSITELCDKVCGSLLKRLQTQAEKLGAV